MQIIKEICDNQSCQKEISPSEEHYHIKYHYNEYSLCKKCNEIFSKLFLDLLSGMYN
jgi:hypothetical protein